MGAISGFAAEPYSYTSLRDVQAASVAACVWREGGEEGSWSSGESELSSRRGEKTKQHSATLVKKAAREFHESRQLADTWPECVESTWVPRGRRASRLDSRRYRAGELPEPRGTISRVPCSA